MRNQDLRIVTFPEVQNTGLKRASWRSASKIPINSNIGNSWGGLIGETGRMTAIEPTALNRRPSGLQ